MATSYDADFDSIVETQYKWGLLGYEFSRNIGWLTDENTGALKKEEYDEFINELENADKTGDYLFSKPFYIYKGIKNRK